jgi:hypothetical protein
MAPALSSRARLASKEPCSATDPVGARHGPTVASAARVGDLRDQLLRSGFVLLLLHQHMFARKQAVLAVRVNVRNFDDLIPDGVRAVDNPDAVVVVLVALFRADGRRRVAADGRYPRVIHARFGAGWVDRRLLSDNGSAEPTFCHQWIYGAHAASASPQLARNASVTSRRPTTGARRDRAAHRR